MSLSAASIALNVVKQGGLAEPHAPVGTAKVGGMPFAGVLQTMVQQTSVLEQKASQAVNGLLTGQGVEIHEAMIATQKADMAFELALQVRNKAVAAYQQMMQMQF